MQDEKYNVGIASGGTNSSSFQIPNWAIFAGAYFPAMDDGAIGLELSFDDTNFYPVLDSLTGGDAVLCASGSDPGFIDISDWIKFIPEKAYARFTCAAQSSGAVTTVVMVRG